ncbi:MAG TPA: hypothetical protein PLJ12_07200, partial [Planctomycetota bacterium]|nr:hypothetical protein [Planctomycetota bacterium]
ILICVNMDGEIASEHYAGVRYRDPETAKLYEAYVTVIASTYRHTPRDYTPEGERIPCPRFGGVTCGEHIAIEPILYEKYFDGQRVSPRHIMVELDKSEVFDVFYAFDTKSVFDTLKKGVEGRVLKPNPYERGDRDWKERLLSRESSDRAFVEQAFEAADEPTKVDMLRTALAAGDAYSGQLMRLALLGGGPSVHLGGTATARQFAWHSMIEDPTMGSLPLMESALELDLDDTDRGSLVSALEKLGEVAPRAKQLATVQRGLLSSSVSPEMAERVSVAQSTDLEAVLEENQAVKDALEARAKEWQAGHEGDGSVELRTAESFLARALDADPRAKQTKLLFEDARTLAAKALAMGQDGWLAHGILAQCEFRYGTLAESEAHVQRAVDTMPTHAMGRVAVETLRLFARSKRRAIRDAMALDATWAPDMLAQAQAAYGVLEHHPLCLEQDCITQVDFLGRIGAYPQAAAVLERGLVRFPDSAELHLRLRNRILATRGATGPGGLEETYAALLAAPEATPNLTWFAGYASLLAAEYHRRAGEIDAAFAAYGRSIEFFETNQAALPGNGVTCQHFVAIAQAAMARMSMERGEWARAHDLMLQAMQTAPESMATVDGLGFTGVMTATTLIARLSENDAPGLSEDLKTALEALSAVTRQRPAFEGTGPSGREPR